MKMKKEKRNLSTSTRRRKKTALQVGEYSRLIIINYECKILVMKFECCPNFEKNTLNALKTLSYVCPLHLVTVPDAHYNV